MLIHSQAMELYALTCIDPVSNLVKIAGFENKSSAHVSMVFEFTWLARYPKPVCCMHNNSNKFIGTNFLHILIVNGVNDVPTTIKNPQSTAICKRMHQTVGNIIHTLSHHAQPPRQDKLQEVHHILDSLLASTMHAIPCTMYHA